MLALTLSLVSLAGVQSPQARCHQPRVLLQLSTGAIHVCRLIPEGPSDGDGQQPGVVWLAPVSRTRDPDRDASRERGKTFLTGAQEKKYMTAVFFHVPA